MELIAKEATNEEGTPKNFPTSFKCPFSGMNVDMPNGMPANMPPNHPQVHPPIKSVTIAATAGDDTATQDTSPTSDEVDDTSSSQNKTSSNTPTGLRRNSNSMVSLSSTALSVNTTNTEYTESGGLSAKATKKLFPYHVVLDDQFNIRSVGNDLPRVFQMRARNLIGQHVDDVLEISKPMGAELSADWVQKLEDQNFTVEPTLLHLQGTPLEFSASLVVLSESPMQTMLILSPDANNLNDLRDMNLTLSDLPAHGSYRDAVFLREHLSTQMNNALNMEKLSKSLKKEKTLLESLLPQHAAEGLRKGQTVEPRIHTNTTIFFSDIVGFTKMCKQIQPYEVIGILNRLYCIMDYLALKFDLYKIETIGDAYVCCSGLPATDPKHAEKVANFAVAVRHCAGHVISPITNEPIELRIGIHTGECASGIVGVTNPRYCVFGDTMNTASRHESTGEAGKIHISIDTINQSIKQSNKHNTNNTVSIHP